MERTSMEQLRAQLAQQTHLNDAISHERELLSRQLAEANKALADAQKAARREGRRAEKVQSEEMLELRSAHAELEKDRTELEEAARGRVRALKALQEESSKQAKALAAERTERQALEAKVAHAKGEVASLESKSARLVRDLRGKDSQCRELRARLEERRSADTSERDERQRLEERVKALGAEVSRKDRAIADLKAKVEQREADLLREQTAVEQRAAHLASQPLKRALERKETALRSGKAKLESCSRELATAQEQLAELQADKAQREARLRRQAEARAETAQVQLSAQLERAAADKEELRLIVHRIAHVLETATSEWEAGGVGGVRASGGGGQRAGATDHASDPFDEELQVRALAHSLLQLSPEQLGLSPRADIATGKAPSDGDDVADFGARAALALAAPSAPHASHTQALLRAAVADPVDAAAAFNIFARLVHQQRTAVTALVSEAEAGAAEVLRLEKSRDWSAMVRQIKSQVLAEKAQAEVAIAERDRAISTMRAKIINAAETADGRGGVLGS